MAQVRLKDENGRFIRFARKREALAMVESGHAIRFDSFTFIQRPADKLSITSRQGEIYELAAIEEHPVIFNGGLNRTESQPARFQRHKGSRVGHQ